MMRSLLALAGLALAASFALAADTPAPLDKMPTVAGGSCGILKSVPMPTVKSSLMYWRCPDSTEHYIVVRNAWKDKVEVLEDSPQGRQRSRAELEQLRKQAAAERMTQDDRRAVKQALAKVRAEVT